MNRGKMRSAIIAFITWLNRDKTVYLLVVSAFVIRAGFGLALGERYLPMADQVLFDELARNLAAGDGLMITERLTQPPEDASPEVLERYYTKPERMRDMRLNALWGVIRPGRPTAFIEPLVPLIFGFLYKVFGAGLLAPRLFQALLDAMVAGMIFRLSRLALPSGSQAPGIAALIYVFYPFSIMFSGALITQPIYLFLQFASIYLFYQFLQKPDWDSAALFGVAFGMTILSRISIITFAPFFLLALVLWKPGPKKWFPAVAALTLAGLMLIPWAARNQRELGESLILPTKGGRNLWEYNNQLFSQERLKAVDLQGIDKLYQDFALKNYERVNGKEYIEFPNFSGQTEIERDRILNHNVTQFIKLNPGIYLKLCALRFYQLFRITPTHHQHPFFKIASWGSFGWILPLSVLGFILLLPHWRRFALIYLLALYNVGVHTLTASGIPHRLPIDPFLIMMAAFGLCWLGGKAGILKTTTVTPELETQ